MSILGTIAAVGAGLGSAIELAKAVRDMTRQGMSDEEIRARVADPNGVLQKVIDDARGRKRRIDDYKANG